MSNNGVCRGWPPGQSRRDTGFREGRGRGHSDCEYKTAQKVGEE